ncbi:unnamed protein product [Rotaria sordida]|uniref:Transposase n=1 Tax=Rotaria sordida TaxID=392033 RepID=A0A820CRZ1_9BILA|nr:unnamed protein product [Rotaria sordida]
MPAGRRHKINIRLGALNLPSPIQKHKRREVQEFILNYVEKAQEQSMITAVEEVVVEADIYVQRQPIQKYNAGRPPALDSAQIKQLDQTIQQNRSATAAELLSLTNFNTTERTIQRYRLFLGYRPRESTPKKEISSLRAHVNLIGFIWWNGYIFRRFDNWLNSDTYCDTVNEALSGNLRKLNGFLFISDGVKWHRSAQFKRWCDKYNIELCE